MAARLVWGLIVVPAIGAICWTAGSLYHARQRIAPGETHSNTQSTDTLPIRSLYELVTSTHRQGSDDAPVLLVEFTGSCEGCAAVDSLVTAAALRFPDQVAVVRWVGTPEPSAPQVSMLAGLDCAVAQGASFRFLRQVFVNRNREIGWNMLQRDSRMTNPSAFLSCVQHSHLQAVRRQIEQADRWKAKAVPSVYANASLISHVERGGALDSVIIKLLRGLDSTQ
jgi:hypothetical protein